MTEDQDSLDVQRVLQGDQSAFEGIVRRWQKPLLNLAWRFCHDPGHAEEMAQEAFLKVFAALPGWRGEGAFSTWLFATAMNVYRSSLRRRKPPGIPLDDAAGVADPRAADLLFEERDRRALVRRAVRALPARYREVIVLYYFFEMDVAGTARALRLPAGTVKARLYRGREILNGRIAAQFRPRPLPREA